MERTDGEAGDGLRMYEELADWFHLLTAPEEYADEAALVLDLLREHVEGSLETLLELGSGGGNTASHLRSHLRLTLTDVAPPIVSARRSTRPPITEGMTAHPGRSATSSGRTTPIRTTRLS